MVNVTIVFNKNGNVKYLNKVTKLTIPHITKDVMISLLRKYKLNLEILELDTTIPKIQYIRLVIGNDQKIRDAKIEYVGPIKDNKFVEFKMDSPKNNNIQYTIHISKDRIQEIMKIIDSIEDEEEELNNKKAIILDSKVIKEFDSKYNDIAPLLNLDNIIELLKNFGISFKEYNSEDSTYMIDDIIFDNIINIDYPLNKDGSIFKYRKVTIKRYMRNGASIKFICKYTNKLITLRLDLLGSTITDIKDKVKVIF